MVGMFTFQKISGTNQISVHLTLSRTTVVMPVVFYYSINKNRYTSQTNRFLFLLLISQKNVLGSRCLYLFKTY